MDINQIAENAWKGYEACKNLNLNQRAQLLNLIALKIESLGSELTETIKEEANLAEARILGEKARTVNQFRAFANDCSNGNWLNVVIDTEDANKTPAKPDLRTMNIPLGPVLVFGASNFPLAYSTAGGDTASALAAGCSVIVKAHPAHIRTSHIIANAIHEAIAESNLPKEIFTHVEDDSANLTATALIQHSLIKAIGFTGSPATGKHIWKLANTRLEPIPVFAEMSSTNPIFILPQKMQNEAEQLATSIAASVQLGCGQFCTNPGILVALKNEATDIFIEAIKKLFENASPAKMLHSGIANNYRVTRETALCQKGVTIIASTSAVANEAEVIPTIASVSAIDFINNKILSEEVFGSFSLLVLCDDMEQMNQVAESIAGQLTCTIMATTEDIAANQSLLNTLQQKCGRFNYNNVPTGVEVCEPMVHGGPWPSTTDNRFTSVGLAAIKRFLRPLCFQNWPDAALHPALQNENTWNINRKVNGVFTKNAITI